jgi:hypothetical protein
VFRSLPLFLLLVGCPQTTGPGVATLVDDDDSASSDDDDAAPDDDDATADDDDTASDDDDTVDDDDAAPDDDDAAPDDDDTAITPAAPGDVVITEVFVRAGSDEEEWFEVFNATPDGIDLKGWTLSDLGGDSHTVADETWIAPFGFVVLGASGDAASNGDVPVDYPYGVGAFPLDDAGDEILLTDAFGTAVDIVVWTAGWPDAAGVAMSLDPTSTDSSDNDLVGAWCDSPAGPWGSGAGEGSPRLPNPACPPPGDDDDASPDDDDTVLDDDDATVDDDDTLPLDDDDATLDDDDTAVDDDDTLPPDDDDAAPGPAAGDLIVTEVFNNPSGDDAGREWFEVHNTTAATIDLLGWTIGDLGSDSHTVGSSVSVAAGGYALLAANGDAGSNGGITPDYVYSGITLGNTVDELVLGAPDGSLIDQVVWDDGATFPDPSGASMSLDPAWSTAGGNDDGEHWCDSPAGTFGSGVDLGSPGAPNPACPALGDDDDSLPPDDDDAAPDPPAPGDVVITEIFADAVGSDQNKEWFELLNVTDADIDLGGWVISDLGTDSHTLAGPFVVPAGGYVVLGQNGSTSSNGGLSVDYDYPGGWTLGNTDDEVVLTDPLGTVIDQVLYDGGPGFPDPEGASLSLAPGSLDAAANDVGTAWCAGQVPYGTDGSLGTPGGPNPPCPAPPVDGDGDGSPADVDCDDEAASVHPGAAEIACDGVDQDCDGADDEPDADGDGFTGCGDDCDDDAPTVNPSAVEIPSNGVDDDCDGAVDEVASGCDLSEVEVNDGWTSAQAMAVNQTICGAVDPAGDVDTFAITVAPWTSISLDVDAQVLGSDLDSLLSLRNSAGVAVASNDDSDGWDSAIDAILVAGGTWYVEVTDVFDDGGPAHTYELSVAASSSCDVIELEPNGSATFADPVLQGEVACGVIADWLDYDTFALTMLAGDTVELDLDAEALGSSLEAQLYVLDRDGFTVLESDEPPGFVDPLIVFTAPANGTYYIEVASDGIFLNTSGPYQLRVNPL